MSDGPSLPPPPAIPSPRWDLRDPRGVVAASPIVNYVGGKDYSRGTNFTCMASSGDGWVAVGAKDGKVRLYNNRSLQQVRGARRLLRCAGSLALPSVPLHL